MGATASAARVPADYRNFHLWMLFPFAISVLGFSYSYYLNLANATFHQHVHGISATLWYLLVVVQPWLITRRHDVRRHRWYGAIGTLLAGLVAGSALTIVPKNIDDVAMLDPNGFFNPTFAYFAVIIDVVLIGLFLASVLMAINAMKQRDLAASVTDTVVTDALDGAPQRVIRTPLVDKLIGSSVVTRPSSTSG